MSIVKSPVLVFQGDSFTWGEGLELENQKILNFVQNVIDSNPNITEYSHNNFSQLTCDNDTLIFRSQHSFTKLVGDYYNAISIKNQNNGGSNMHSLVTLERTLSLLGNNVDLVVIQLTHLLRDMTHNHIYPLLFKELGLHECLSNYYVDSNDDMLNEIITDFRDFYMPYWKSWDLCITDTITGGVEIPKKFENNRSRYDEMFNNTPHYFDFNCGIQLQNKFGTCDAFILEIYKLVYEKMNNLIQDIENKYKTKVHIIGSWSESDFEYDEILSNNRDLLEIQSRYIPMTYNGTVYNTIYEIMELYEGFDLYELFPELNNHHPTIKFNKLLADNIIDYINNNNLL